MSYLHWDLDPLEQLYFQHMTHKLFLNMTEDPLKLPSIF